jgi:hypothetical protein
MPVQVIVPRPAATERRVSIFPASVADGRSDPQQFTAALCAAVPDRIEQTSEGVRAWAYRHDIFTIGPLLAVLGEPALERSLAHHGISHHTVKIVPSPDAAWRVDDVLGRI